MTRTTLLLLPLIALFSCTQKEDSTPDSSGIETKSMPHGPFLGETAGDEPRRFADGFVSTPQNELNGLFNPEGNEFYFSMDAPRGDFAVVLMTRQDANGDWSEVEIAPFSGQYSDVDPIMSPDGKRIYFCSTRPRPGNPEPQDADIWYVDRSGSGWGEPVWLDSTVNTPRNDWYCSSTRTGNLYYSTWDPDRKTDDIFRAIPTEEGYLRENVGDGVNTGSVEFDPFVAPDESYLLFSSWRRDGHGNTDIYISFQVDGKWSKAQNLGDKVNSSGKDYCPWVSQDGQYFFFTSMRTEEKYPGMADPTLAGLRNKMQSIDNGLGNVYWMKADFIEEMRPATGE